MVCPCCAPSPEPCCDECGAPYAWPTSFLYGFAEEQVPCNDPFSGTLSAVYQDIFINGVPYYPYFPEGLGFNEGYPSPELPCGWLWVHERSEMACCVSCLNANDDPIQFRSIHKTKYQDRIFKVVCPDGPESAAFVDVTDDALYGPTEREVIFDESVYPCKAGTISYTCDEYLPFFPTPEPVCNPLP